MTRVRSGHRDVSRHSSHPTVRCVVSLHTDHWSLTGVARARDWSLHTGVVCGVGMLCICETVMNGKRFYVPACFTVDNLHAVTRFKISFGMRTIKALCALPSASGVSVRLMTHVTRYGIRLYLVCQLSSKAVSHGTRCITPKRQAASARCLREHTVTQRRLSSVGGWGWRTRCVRAM